MYISSQWNKLSSIVVKSVRENSYDKDCPFVIYSENSDDGTNEWLEENKEKYNLDVYVETKIKSDEVLVVE